MRTAVLCVILTLLTTPGTPARALSREAVPQSVATDYLEMAGLGIETLQGWYVWGTGLWATTGWWNSANALTALVNYSIASGSGSYLPVVLNTW